jgi:hypothetical protein
MWPNQRPRVSLLKIGRWAWLWNTTPTLTPEIQPSRKPAPRAKATLSAIVSMPLTSGVSHS